MNRLCRAFAASSIVFVLIVFPPVLVAQSFAARAAGAAGEATADRPERLDMLVGRSKVVRMERPITRVSLSTPDIADAMVTSPYELLIHGKAPGTISLFVWSDGGRIKTYDVAVTRDLAQLQDQVKALFPGEQIDVTTSGKEVVLSGVVSTKFTGERAAALAAGYVDKPENVVNLLRQREGVATNQVMLQVRFAEVSRNALQELGSSFFTGLAGHKDWVGRSTTEQFEAPDFDNQKGLVFSDFLNIFLFNTKENVGTLIRALKTRGLFQSLAEPNLITQDGKEATFLAGGEYPYPVVQAGTGSTSITIVFKEFGIRLKFTPTILSGDMIHLKVNPEVSTLDFNNALTLQGFRIPALSTRRTETEVELRDGQTFAVAGMLDNSVSQTLSRVPGIGDIPVLGYLFRSRAYQKQSTELVVMITPRIVHRDSPGVTPNLPGPVQPYLGNERRLPVPPAAFSGTQSQVQQQQQFDGPNAAAKDVAQVSQAVSATAAQASSATPMAVAPMPTPSPVQAAAAPTPAMSDNLKADREALARAQAEDQKRGKKDAELSAKTSAAQAQRDRERAERKRIDDAKQEAAARKIAEETAAKQGEIDRKRLAEEQKKAARDKEMATQIAKADAKQKAEQAKIDAKHQEEEKKLAEKRKAAEDKLAKEREEQVTRVMQQYSGR